MESNKQEYDHLITGYIQGILSDEEAKRLAMLLKTEERCRDRYNELIRVYGKSRILLFEQKKEQNYQHLCRKIEFTHPKDTKKINLWSRIQRTASIILIIILSGAVSYFLYRDHQLPPTINNVVEVPLGSQTKLILPDGSVVWLNSGSVLTYGSDFGKKNRKLSLLGEGYFEVSKDKQKEFIVSSDDLNIKVLGTKFNVKANPSDPYINVSLLEGLVKVYTHSPDGNSYLIDRDLLPNQNFEYNKETKTGKVTTIEAYKKVLWVEGKFSFVNNPLSEIMKDIERAYNIRIEIKSDKIEKEFFSGSVSLDLSIDEILSYIDVDSKYSWTLKGNVLTIEDKN